jgi:hypothetical protein
VSTLQGVRQPARYRASRAPSPQHPQPLPLFGVHPLGCPFLLSNRRNASAVLGGFEFRQVLECGCPLPL